MEKLGSTLWKNIIVPVEVEVNLLVFEIIVPENLVVERFVVEPNIGEVVYEERKVIWKVIKPPIGRYDWEILTKKK